MKFVEQAFGFLSTEVDTIAIGSGVLTITSAYVIAQAETGTADDIDTITPNISNINNTDSFLLVVEADAGDTITLKHGTGNLTLAGAADIVLSGGERSLLFGDGTNGFTDLATSSGGGGIGGSTGGTDNALLRADGTGGSTLQNSGVIVDDSDNVSGINSLESANAAGLDIKDQADNTKVARLDVSGITAATTRTITMPDKDGTLFGLYTSVAIMRDEKGTGTAGGASSSSTWNNRDLNTEVYDPDNIVSIASNQFTPISGDYVMYAYAPAGHASSITLHRLRLYNVTAASAVEEGLSVANPSGTRAIAPLTVKFTANGTDAYRIDHYTNTAQVTSGLGAAVSDGSSEVYLVIKLLKLT